MYDDWNNTHLIVAHPDDECLWFSSILEQVTSTTICFGPVKSNEVWTTGRREAALSIPLQNVQHLELTESEVFESANWDEPVTQDHGMTVKHHGNSLPGYSLSTYRQNFDALLSALRKRLENADRVFTHNPWGEYGHEEHVQVFCAVQQLRKELDFELWVSGYVSKKSYRLFINHEADIDGAPLTLPTNEKLGRVLMDHYKQRNCWTWFDDYQWPDEESFFRIGAVAPPATQGVVLPVNHITVSPPRAQPSRLKTELIKATSKQGRRIVRVMKRLSTRK